jgi:hypothetical protein
MRAGNSVIAEKKSRLTLQVVVHTKERKVVSVRL